jgi:hypothetical protein
MDEEDSGVCEMQLAMKADVGGEGGGGMSVIGCRESLEEITVSG